LLRWKKKYSKKFAKKERGKILRTEGAGQKEERAGRRFAGKPHARQEKPVKEGAWQTDSALKTKKKKST